MTPSRLERLYVSALRLYPARFQSAYADPMQQAFRDALADTSLPRPVLLRTVLHDLVTSVIQENLATSRRDVILTSPERCHPEFPERCHLLLT